MNILITGSKGQLGTELSDILTKIDKIKAFETDIDTLDISNQSEIEKFIKSNSINLIVNCAAYTAVDKAENEQDKAFLINSKAATFLAIAAKNNNCNYISVSTDYVFNGKAHKPYTEANETNPVSVYGKSKLDGENKILNVLPESIIIRTSWLYSIYGNNFVKTISKIAKQNNEIKVVSDQIGTPTNAKNLAEAISEIISTLKNNPNNSYGGIYHYSNEGVCSWYDFAKAIVGFNNLKTKVIPVNSNQFPTIAKRPYYSVLDKKKIKDVFSIEIPHWQESLSETINELK